MNRHTRPRLVCGAALALMAIIAAPSFAATQDELLEEILAANEAARDRIASVQYKAQMVWQRHRPRPAGKQDWPMRTETVIVERAAGTQRITELQMRNDNDPDRAAVVIRHVVNHQYAAFWVVGSGAAHRWNHTSIDLMDRRVKLSAHREDSIHIAFSGDREAANLRELHRRSMVHFTSWRVEPPAAKGGPHVVTIFAHADAGGQRQSRLTIDPSRGWTVTETVTYSDGVNESMRITVEPQQIGEEGVWFPRRIVNQINTPPQAPTNNQPQLDHTRTIDVMEVRINPPLDPSVFTMDGLNLSEETRLFHYNVDGSRERYIMHNAQLITLEEYYKMLERAR